LDGDLALVGKCIQDGVNVNATSKAALMNTPLHNACSRGNYDVIALLLDNGAKIEMQNITGETAIFLAVQNKFLKVVQLLIERGADLTTVDNHDNNLLHKAAMVDHPLICPIIELLIAKGVDSKAKNGNGKKPFELAKHHEVIKALSN